MFYVKKSKERKEEGNIKYNEKDLFTPPIFKGERERWVVAV